MKCKYCGQELIEGTNSCMYCGKSVVEKPLKTKEISIEEKKILKIKRVLAKTIAVYSIIFGCLGVIGVYGISDNILLSYILIVASIVLGPIVIHYANKNQLIELPFIIILVAIYSIFEYMSLALLVDPDLMTYFWIYLGMVGFPILISILYFISAIIFSRYKKNHS